MTRVTISIGAAIVIALAAGTAGRADDHSKPKRPPRGAMVLFDGTSSSLLRNWTHLDGRPVEWTVADGAMEVNPGKGNIITKDKFGSYQLHVEFMTPLMPDKKSQERGNSGVYQHGRYEVQVLDSYNNDTYKYGGCGAIYEQKDPDKKVCKPPLTWQTYDITFTAPKVDSDGKVAERPRITVVWNGVKVHDNVEILADNTRAGMTGPVPATGPIMLQDHGCRVKFRNIWIKPM